VNAHSKKNENCLEKLNFALVFQRSCFSNQGIPKEVLELVFSFITPPELACTPQLLQKKSGYFNTKGNHLRTFIECVEGSLFH